MGQQGWTPIEEPTGWTAVDQPVASHAPASQRTFGDNSFGQKWADPNYPVPTLSEVAPRIPGALAEAALSEFGGRLVGGALRTVGRGLYRAGALPLQQMFGKYGDLIVKGLEEGVPVTQGGFKKAGALKTTAQASKQAAIDAADQIAGFRTQGVMDDALSRVEGNAERLRKAGMGDPSKVYQARAGRIVSENGPGMKPSELEALKGTVDDTLGGAYKKLRMKEALSPNEQMSMAISHATGDAQTSVVPGYKGLNKDIMDAEGLRRMIGRRLQGNQGLENALTMAVGPAAIPARIAMLPGVASTAGIAAYKSAPVMSGATRAALLALMGSQDQ